MKYSTDLVVLLLLVAPTVVTAQQTQPAATGPAQAGADRTFYASPTGAGTGSSPDSPFEVAEFWALAEPGDTLVLLDGTYRGPRSMLVPPAGLSGLADAPITVGALHDGAVTIDGGGDCVPINLRGVDYWVVQGLNAHGSSGAVVELNDCNHCQIKRVCAWDAAEGNNVVFGVHYGSHNLLEDCAGWGRARKIFSASQNGNCTTFRRCWGRFEACESVGNKMTFSTVYNNYNTLFENCIGAWDVSVGKLPSSFVLKDYDGTEFTRISTAGVALPDGEAIKGSYRPNGAYNGKPRYLDYYAADAYVYIWWSKDLSAWVISQGTSSGPGLTNYWYKTTNPDAPFGTYRPGPTTNGDPVVEACTVNDQALSEMFGIFGAEGFWGSGWDENANLRMRGCIAYVTASQKASGFPGLFFMTTTSSVDLQDCAAYVDPQAIGRYGTSPIKPFYLMPNRDDPSKDQNLVGRDLTSIGADDYVNAKWTVSGRYHSSSGPLPLTRSGGRGADLTHRYVDGVLTEDDLWPWPMDQRIYDAMVQGGYTHPVHVTQTIMQLGQRAPGGSRADGMRAR